ncbi:MAG: hypothetical protein KF901_15050 [Myxococcales bacterium]|nr:hypothetical protein [Myxococcales bacterium]
MGTRIGTALDQHTAQLETCARGAEKLPPEAVTICVGLDRTSAPMEETLPEDAPRRERVKPRVRKAPPPVTVNYRMAYVGTVSLVDAGGEVIQTYKYAATAEDGPQQVLHSMMQDVRRAQRQDRSLRVIVVQDAAREMWNLVVEALHAEPSVDHWDELIDHHHHGTAHMWKAASAMAANTNATMERWLGDLRRSDDAIDRIAAELDVERQLGYHPTFRIILEDELTFITNNGARLRYASLRDAGFPIGSGPTEGACKSFFSIRCKRSGQRWRNPGLAAVLASRSHLLNGRLSAVMRNLRKRFYTAQIETLPRAA